MPPASVLCDDDEALQCSVVDDSHVLALIAVITLHALWVWYCRPAGPACDTYEYSGTNACGVDREEPADPAAVTCTGGTCTEELCCVDTVEDGEWACRSWPKTHLFSRFRDLLLLILLKHTFHIGSRQAGGCSSRGYQLADGAGGAGRACGWQGVSRMAVTIPSPVKCGRKLLAALVIYVAPISKLSISKNRFYSPGSRGRIRGR